MPSTFSELEVTLCSSEDIHLIMLSTVTLVFSRSLQFIREKTLVEQIQKGQIQKGDLKGREEKRLDWL
jgi:hypothetical protein